MNTELKAHAYPAKEFFVDMITKDIQLQDCILDLLDNCIDGAMKQKSISMKEPTSENAYEGCHATINFSETDFSIVDNCGGISLDDAINHAFHFGRRPQRNSESQQETASIGLYGIGMKRAIFKIGRMAKVVSNHPSKSFQVTIDVNSWLEKDEKDWDFDIDDATPLSEFGTDVSISSLCRDAAEDFNSQSFIDTLRSSVGRDYSLFIQKHFMISINGSKIRPYQFGLRSSDEFSPANINYIDEETGVRVVIKAGMAKLPPEDSEPEERSNPETNYYGWFVICNDRAVLVGDKTVKTGWGKEGFPFWHPQFNGFQGMVMFYSDDPILLPWTTTKRDVDVSSPLYQRAITRMKLFTRKWIDYTNARKASLELAKEKETKTDYMTLSEILPSDEIILPTFVRPSGPKLATVSYSLPKNKIKLAAKALGNSRLSNKAVGEKTFDYYYEREVSEE